MISAIVSGSRLIALALILVATVVATSTDAEARPISPGALAAWCEDKGGYFHPTWEGGLLAGYDCVTSKGIISCDYGGQCDYFPASAKSAPRYDTGASSSSAADTSYGGFASEAVGR